MREFSVEPLYEVPAEANLTDLVHRNAAEAPDKAVLARKIDGVWHDVTAREFLDEVIAVARGLVASGVNAGDRVAIMSRTRYEWSLLDFAIFEAGAVPVPIYETSSAEQVAWILSDSGAMAVFAELPANNAVIESVRDRAAGLKHVWQIESDGRPGAMALLTAAGADVPASVLDERRATLRSDSTATIIYTSGTTGRPKGCVLSHGSLMADGCNAVDFLTKVFRGETVGEDATTLLFLPMAHVFARIIHIGSIYARAKLGHCSDAKNVLPELASFQPTFILSVPRVFEKVYNGASQKAHAESKVKGRIFDAATETAIAWSQAYEAGKVPLGLSLKHKVFDRLVYGKLRAALGGNTKAAISGGAPLGARLTHFFRGVGLFVCEGYGMTETSPAVSVNPYPNAKAGTVGRPLPGVTVRIADDGEIEVNGALLFKGYWNNDAATAEAFTADGYLKTGDLGRLDDEGYLSITGRKKEILVTAGGKNVAPAVLEDRLNAHPLINQTMVVGDKQPFIAALITLDPEALPTWLEHNGRDRGTPLAQLAGDPAVLQEIEAAVSRANEAVSKAESIRKFTVLPVEWTIDAGQITPSMKIKRNVIADQFAEEIDKLYAH
ncbi:MAG TPA: AMP-dependent synthetase/ligase [Actinocrinis sp.]|uniref:AMP-dependent synthetase/ligase n=1 Tax=Actinocrinis sp. TaxID=1920516 RepID=UPI002DDD03E7|nr:AMP-dependent synthetase/ligase [Actinocrinis sp.]HEV2342884.1 AMP-dependent synthetase/ligase [Actinocrinis sp.]